MMYKTLDAREAQAVQDLIAETQHRIQMLMRDRDMNRADLARALGLSKARMTQLFGPKPNITLETLGCIFFALNEAPEVTSARLRKLLEVERVEISAELVQEPDPDEANDNRIVRAA